VNGILERLFEDAQVKEYFEDWQKDPTILKEAYDLTLE